MQIEALLYDIEVYVGNLFSSHQLPFLKYHNLTHTQLVVQHAAEIAGYYNFDKETLFSIRAAAWFHDTGHLIGPMNIHEENGVKLMREFLEKKELEHSLLAKISDCIMATKMPTHPHSLPEAVLCDADTYHLGTLEFFETDKLVWEEMEMRTNKKIEHKTEKTLPFLLSHNFYTSYCKNRLDEGKRKNIQIVQSILEQD